MMYETSLDAALFAFDFYKLCLLLALPLSGPLNILYNSHQWDSLPNVLSDQ
jgi:hypothetical protein